MTQLSSTNPINYCEKRDYISYEVDFLSAFQSAFFSAMYNLLDQLYENISSKKEIL